MSINTLHLIGSHPDAEAFAYMALEKFSKIGNGYPGLVIAESNSHENCAKAFEVQLILHNLTPDLVIGPEFPNRSISTVQALLEKATGTLITFSHDGVRCTNPHLTKQIPAFHAIVVVSDNPNLKIPLAADSQLQRLHALFDEQSNYSVPFICGSIQG